MSCVLELRILISHSVHPPWRRGVHVEECIEEMQSRRGWHVAGDFYNHNVTRCEGGERLPASGFHPQVCARDVFNGAGRPRAHTGGRVWFRQARVCARKGRHRGSSHTSKNFCDDRCLCRMLHTCRRITSAPMVALMLLSGDHEFARCRVFRAFGL